MPKPSPLNLLYILLVSYGWSPCLIVPLTSSWNSLRACSVSRYFTLVRLPVTGPTLGAPTALSDSVTLMGLLSVRPAPVDMSRPPVLGVWSAPPPPLGVLSTPPPPPKSDGGLAYF